jgi:hypothetical protein
MRFHGDSRGEACMTAIRALDGTEVVVKLNPPAASA